MKSHSIEISVALIAICLFTAVGFYFGLLQSNPGAFLDEILKYQVLLSTMIAAVAALMTWVVARTNLAAAQAAKENERSQISSSVKAECVSRIRNAFQAYASVRYRLYHSPPNEQVGDIQLFINDAKNASAACDAAITRAWPLMGQVHAADRANLVNLINILENLRNSFPGGIDLAERTIKGEKKIATLRAGFDLFFDQVANEMGDELKSDLKGWIADAEATVKSMDELVRTVP